MFKFFIRRVLYSVPILLGVTLLTFFLFNVAGGDPAIHAAGRYATAADIARTRHQMGLDQPLVMQYLQLLKEIFTLDFGRSWSSKQPINQLLAAGVGPSLSITGPAFLIALLVNIPVAMVMAYKRNSVFDKTVLISCLAMISVSSVVYVMAGQYFVSYKLGLFPISGWDPGWVDRWPFAALPILILVILSLGGDILFFRTVFLEEMHQDYVRTARSKGVSERSILFKHVLRNALIPIITLLVLEIPFLIVGSLLIESYFGIPGLGDLTYQAIQEADFPTIKAITVMGAIVYILLQLVSDMLYALADPKIRLE